MKATHCTMTWLLTLGALVLPIPWAEANVGEEAYPLYWQVDPDGDGPIEAGEEVHNSSATLWRDEAGVSFRIQTTGLTEGHGFTVWFFSYDNPVACLTGDGEPGTRCTGADLLNPAALGSIMWGRAGGFVESNALTTFTGRRPANSGPCITEPALVDQENCAGVLLGHGLHNPMGAEIHFVLRDHGPAQEGLEEEQTSTINGGCDPATHEGLPVFAPGWGTPGNYACYDPQGNN